jgi:hypothetical protein
MWGQIEAIFNTFCLNGFYAFDFCRYKLFAFICLYRFRFLLLPVQRMAIVVVMTAWRQHPESTFFGFLRFFFRTPL